MHLSTDYPWFFIFFCLLIGTAYSALLYYLPIRHKKTVLPVRVKTILSIVRFLSVSIIAFLLLSPLVTRVVHEHEKPLVIIAQDNSQSPSLCYDSAYYRGEYAKAMDRLIDKLKDNYEVACYSYGSNVTRLSDNNSKIQYSEDETDMSALIKELGERYERRNVGALILSGDGIYNKGGNPATSAHRLNFPIYTIAMGDTSIQQDASIANIRYNRETATGRKFPVEITIQANRLKGKHAELQVSDRSGRNSLFRKSLNYNSNRFTSTETVLISEDKPGIYSYKISLSVADGESSAANNSAIIHIQVRDDKVKVLIVAAAPHPDVAAVKRSLESIDGYEVESLLADDMKNGKASRKIEDYDLAILHQLPANGAYDPCLSLNRAHVPILYIIGTQTDISAFNKLQTGITINTNLQRSVDATAKDNSSFTAFALDGNAISSIESYPPLQAPFGNYAVSPSVQTIFYAKIGNIVSEQPLIAVGTSKDLRSAFIIGEGLWQWRIHEQAKKEGAALDNLLAQLCLYTTTQVKHNQLKVIVRPIYRDNEQVYLGAELYDDNLQLTNAPDVKIDIVGNDHETNSKTHSEYVFLRTSAAYRLNIGFLPEGSYSYSASASLGNKTLKSTGSFVVSHTNIEAVNLTADHSLLYTIASQSDGRMVDAHNIDSIALWLNNRDDIKTVIHRHTINTPIVNMWWVFVLILLLLSAEWALRKYYQEI